MKEELYLFSCSGHGGVQSVQVHHQVAAGTVQQFRACQPQQPSTTPAVGCLVSLQDSFQSACGDTSGGHIEPQRILQANRRIQLLSQLWEEGGWQDVNISCVRMCKDLSAQASFSLDMELEMQRQRAVKRSLSAIHDQGESMAISMGSTEQPSGAEEAEPPGGSMASSCAEDCSEYCDWTYDNCPGILANEEEASRYEPENDNVAYHSIMEEVGSILMYKARNEGTPDSNETRPNQDGLVRLVPRESQCTPDSEKRGAVHLCTGGAPAAVMTPAQYGNDVSVCSPVNLNQTFDLSPSRVTEARQSTADHSTNTSPKVTKYDVLMKFAQEELKELKEKMASSADGVSVRDGGGCGDWDRGQCDCAQRVTQAELSLLTLQYGICQQQCWRRYNTSPEGDHRRSQQLQVEDIRVEDVSVGGEEEGELNRLVSQMMGWLARRVHPKAEGPVVHPKNLGSRSGKAVILLPQQPVANRGARLGGTKDHNSSEAWYEAEEDIGPEGGVLKEGGLAVVMEEGENGKYWVVEKAA
ncbi:unnamed protein product [Coregonus sp. 'balchen']|nr:unnamed protein product [Coregonus sp. 'balchen']